MHKPFSLTQRKTFAKLPQSSKFLVLNMREI